MTVLEKKALQHAINKLKDYSTSHVYSFMRETLIEAGLDSHRVKQEMERYAEISKLEYNKIKEAREWIESVIDGNNV